MAEKLVSVNPVPGKLLRRSLWILVLPFGVILAWLFVPAQGHDAGLGGAVLWAIAPASLFLLLAWGRDRVSSLTSISVWDDARVTTEGGMREHMLDVGGASFVQMVVDDVDESIEVRAVPKTSRPLFVMGSLLEADVDRFLKALVQANPDLKTRYTRVVRVPTYLYPRFKFRSWRLNRLYKRLDEAGPELHESGRLRMISAAVRPDINIVEVGVEGDVENAVGVLSERFPIDRLRIFQLNAEG